MLNVFLIVILVRNTDFEKLNVEITIEFIGDSSAVKKGFIFDAPIEELKVRFKYAALNHNSVTVEKDYSRVIYEIIENNKEQLPVYILPTYTAMFDFRRALAKKYKIRKFWK